MWHVKDVGDVILIFFECDSIDVEDVEDRSNTPKGCHAMYVKDGKRTYTHFLMSGMWHFEGVRDVILIFYDCNVVMQSMSKISKIGKDHTHTFCS